MNFLSGTWSGTISGTNVGTFTLELHDSAGQLTGLLSLTEPGAGLFVYDCTGEVNETRVTLRVSPRVVPDEAQASEGTARASIQPDGSLAGDWEMNRGTSGTFFARKQVLAQPVAARGGSSATPAMAVSFEKSTRISSCVVDIDVLKRIYRELSTGSDEAARLELARQHQLAMAPASVGAPPQTPDYAQIRSHYSITILARGLNGEQIFSLDPGLLNTTLLD
jgi:hypothetical protein